MSNNLHDRLTEALTREHYRRARERIAASPEEHSAAMADVAMGVLAAQDVGELRAQIAQATIVRPGDTVILRVADRPPMEHIDRTRQVVREALPDVEVLFVGGVEEMAIYRPQAEAVTIRPGDAVLVRDGDRELVMDPADITVVRSA